MSALAQINCGKCRQGFDGTDALVRVTQCGDVFHKACFFSGEHITKVNDIVTKVLCPACNRKIVGETRRSKAQDGNEKIQVLEFPKPPAPQPPVTPPATKETRGLKYVTYFAVALLCITIAGVIYPSWIALGIGVAVTVPIAYLIGRKVEQYHAKSV